MNHSTFTDPEQCAGREQLTQKQANEVVRRTKHHTHAYSCPHCGHWHVGVPRRSKKNSMGYIRR